MRNIKVIKLVKKKKVIHIVVMFKNRRIKSRYIERLGFISSFKIDTISINLFRLGYWLNKGVIMTKGVKKCFIRNSLGYLGT